MRKFYLLGLVALVTMLMAGCKENHTPDEPHVDPAQAGEYVVYGKIFTAEYDPNSVLPAGYNYQIAEAMVVKDGRYIFVGSKADAQYYITANTTVIDYTEKGLIMPSCTNGHAHYMMGYAAKSIGVEIKAEDDVPRFLQIVGEAAIKARQEHKSSIFGSGWNYHLFKVNMPTRQQLDSVCSDIPICFSDEEGHKCLANTLSLQMAGILDNQGEPIPGVEIRGGEIVKGKDGKPNGLLFEQAGTYVREKIRVGDLYTLDVATQDFRKIEQYLLSQGYTIYMDGWSNYFSNTNFYQAVNQLDTDGQLHVILGLSYEIESWMNPNDALVAASTAKQYASKHVLPQWIKLFIDGTVEGGTGYSAIPYPDGHQGIVNWSKDEVTTIINKANKDGLSMHIHTMGDSAVALAVDAFVAGGQDDKRNTIVHVRNILPSSLQKMEAHSICATAGMLWHHFHWLAPTILWLTGLVPVGYEEMSYPMKSFFNYGINVSSHSDYPALTGSPDDPFGIMEIAVTGVLDSESEDVWWPSELITRGQALQALTINGARQLFLENERGSIKVGKYADFIVIDQDVLTCPVKDIHNTHVLRTYFEGKQVY